MFYKKSISFLIALILTLCAILMSGQVLLAKADVDEQDQCFLSFVREDTGLFDVTYSSTNLYDENLVETGRQYVFTVGGVQGYALTAKFTTTDGYLYEVEELFYNKPAPFTGYQGLPVYLTFQTYLDYVDGIFYDLSNNRAIVSSETIDALAYKGFGYMDSGSTEPVTTTETINYATKNTETYRFPYDAPNLYGSLNGSCCANNAGAVIIGYYDRFYENLMPNHQAYIVFGGTIKYKNTSAEITALVGTMKEYMAVDGVEQGTTFSGFQQGMERYVEEKGYTYSTTSMMSWGSFNFESYKNTVSNEIPVAIFLNGYTMNNGITEEDNADNISNSYRAATHVEVGIGYRIDTYYNANGGVVATRKYARVASGLSAYGIGYLNVSSNVSGQVVNAIAVNIN